MAEPSINVTPKAAEKILEISKEGPNKYLGLRVYVQGGGCSGFQYGLMLEENEPGPTDQIYEINGVKLFVDPISLTYLKGATVDYVEDGASGGFSITNPNATSTCGCGQSFDTGQGQ